MVRECDVYFTECVNARALVRASFCSRWCKHNTSKSNQHVTFFILREKAAVPRHPCKESHLIMKVFQKKSRSPVKEKPRGRVSPEEKCLSFKENRSLSIRDL